MDASRPREVKCVVLGDTGVGKSSLVLRFVSGNFKPYSESTIGASFQSKYIVHKGQSLKYQVWDTAGQEKYRSLAPMYYRGAAAAVVVYDITRAHTFRTLRMWIDELKAQGPKEIAIAIAGNKSDMKDAREVESSMAQEYASEIGALFMETSAKDESNVAEIFLKLSERLPPPIRTDANTISLKDSARNLQQQRSQSTKKKNCC